MTDRPRLLPLLSSKRHGGRDEMTCRYRCGNACDHPVPNESGNPYLGDVVAAGISRRGVMRAGAAGALVLSAGGAATAVPAPAAAHAVPSPTGPAGGRLTFAPIPPNTLDNLVVPNGYHTAVVIRWGDPVLAGAPGLDVTNRGTVLSGGENFNQYFVGGDGVPESLKPKLARYGISTTARYPADSRKWDRVQERFDLARHPNEAHRFGWIVEIDPYDPRSRPRKHTALGRFKHEGANVIVARDGRVAAYLGDDERFDYLYKFVSDRRYRPGDRRHNLTLLESGTLSVAKVTGDGTGQWVKLVSGARSFVPGMTAEEVLVFTRLAGDTVGATRMDRPEDVEPNPVTGRIYAAMTNNTSRGVGTNPGVDQANPRPNNRHGHILEITEDGGDHTAETFTWALPIICGDPAQPDTYFAGYDKSAVSPISCPDNVAFDRAGNLWIATDGNALGSNDGLFATAIGGPERGHLKQFLTVPLGAETCGPFLTSDDRSVFTAVQHPGERTGASLETPASTWPDGDFAKPAVVVTWRQDGGPIGS
ncbi:MAG TPA: alkaline phosphatase PhoX [Actinoplanes sp.]|nr:alkaline phosphatase PhoX [Actinoplanes sp.]